MKVLGLFILLFVGLFNTNLRAQLNAADSLFFEAYEDTINAYSDSLFNSNIEKNRKFASHAIAKTLTKALKRTNSFSYGFPNLKAISIVKPKDESFRIFTYQLIYNNNTYKYFGAIQMNSPDLELTPLIDKSAMMDDEISTLITDSDEWYGVLYYGVQKVKSGKQTYYTLFGYDGNNALSTKKIMDVLWFDSDKNVKFGAPIIEMSDGKIQMRYIMEYRKGVSAGIRYSDEYQKIMFDHLIPENVGGEGQYFTYVPDGSYNGFEWKKDKWVFIDKLFDFKLEDGEFPIGN